VVTSLEARVKFTFDGAVWEDYVRRISAAFKDFDQIQSGDVADRVVHGKFAHHGHSQRNQADPF